MRKGLFFLIMSVFCLTATAGQSVKLHMVTSRGDIEIVVYPDRAPVTAQNFLQLVDGGYFNGASFYRAVTYDNDNGKPKIEVIQGGRWKDSSPFPPIEHETTEMTGILHEDGVISMGRGAVGTASTEFFICVGDQPALDYGHSRFADKQGFAAFGRVIKGMELVRAFIRQPTTGVSDSSYYKGQILIEPVEIKHVGRID